MGQLLIKVGGGGDSGWQDGDIISATPDGGTPSRSKFARLRCVRVRLPLSRAQAAALVAGDTMDSDQKGRQRLFRINWRAGLLDKAKLRARGRTATLLDVLNPTIEVDPVTASVTIASKV